MYFFRFPTSRFDRVKKSSFLKGFVGQLRANSGSVKKGRFHNGVACKNGHFRKGLSESLISFVSTRYFDSFFWVSSDFRFLDSIGSRNHRLEGIGSVLNIPIRLASRLEHAIRSVLNIPIRSASRLEHAIRSVFSLRKYIRASFCIFSDSRLLDSIESRNHRF